MRKHIVSGAGRQETYRSETALALRRTWEAGSIAWVMDRILAMSFRSPSPSREAGSLQTSSSTRCRSSRSRQAVSRTRRVARHSLSTPDARAARVWGISCTRALPNPRWRLPRCGESLRAKATCAPTPRPSCPEGTPARDCARRWDASNTAAARACTAAAADFNSSNTRIKSTRFGSAQASDRSSQLAGSCRQCRHSLTLFKSLCAAGTNSGGKRTE